MIAPNGRILQRWADRERDCMGEIARLEREMHALADRLASHPPRREAEELTTRYGEIQGEYQDRGGYELLCVLEIRQTVGAAARRSSA